MEMRKKRSKFTPEELSLRQKILVDLQAEIQAVKELQRAGYVKGYKGAQMVTMEQSEMFRPVTAAGCLEITFILNLRNREV
jgi:hypothetical protein